MRLKRNRQRVPVETSGTEDRVTFTPSAAAGNRDGRPYLRHHNLKGDHDAPSTLHPVGAAVPGEPHRRSDSPSQFHGRRGAAPLHKRYAFRIDPAGDREGRPYHNLKGDNDPPSALLPVGAAVPGGPHRRSDSPSQFRGRRGAATLPRRYAFRSEPAGDRDGRPYRTDIHSGPYDVEIPRVSFTP